VRALGLAALLATAAAGDLVRRVAEAYVTLLVLWWCLS
jgi:hypothetical protein